MRSSSLLAIRPRRVLAVAGLVSLGSGVLMLTAAAHPVLAAASMQSASPAGYSPAMVSHGRPGKPSRAAVKEFERQVKTQTKHLAAISQSPTTVPGPHMWDPSLNHGKGGPNPNASSVTVSETSNMVDQQIQVSWTNFTPSSALIYNASNTYYPVMLAECDSASPASPADCYAAEAGGVTSVSGPDGPDNTAYGTTGPDGTGLADIHILTGVDNPFLGCAKSHTCSLVIVPAQGGNIAKTPADCADHSTDAGFGGTALGNIDFGSSPNEYLCSWAQRIVVPLTFAPSAKDCPLRSPLFNVAGSPMLDRAMQSWTTALCLGSHGFFVNYTPSVAEPQALQELPSGSTDVALTTRTADAQGISLGTKHYLYAPVGVSAVSVAYWFDNPLTGLPESGVELDQRLMLKLLTQSYAFENDGCPINPPPPIGCDNGVDHNPANLFLDPEFTQLNPNILEPVNGPIEIPTVMSGQTDMTWDLTSWIAANKDAAGFLAGQFDPWGMHLNTNYTNLAYPYNDFVGQDNYPIIAQEYNPVFPLTTVASDMVENWPPGFSITKDEQGNFDRLPAQPVGQRALITILDQADSAAYLFPSAAIPNATGTYTEPTTSAMEAALQGMANAGDGTEQPNLNSTNKAAYPLTMVIYAVVPTSGTSHAKAAGIAKFLDYAAGLGQHPGVQPGQLPPGYAPLPASLAAQTRKDAIAVLNQTGASPPKTTNPGTGSGTGSTSGSSSSTGKSGSVGLPTVGPSAAAIPGISLVSDEHAQPAPFTRYIFPALLILGGLAALAGSSSLIGASPVPLSTRVRRIGQGTAAWGRTTRSRLGLRRSK
jgi:hypothetical protein